MAFFGGDRFCRLCHGSDESMDHLTTLCPVSIRAKALITNLSFDRTAIDSLLAATVDDFRFENSLTPDAGLVLLIFSFAIWSSAREIQDHSPPPLS